LKYTLAPARAGTARRGPGIVRWLFQDGKVRSPLITFASLYVREIIRLDSASGLYVWRPG
jgi:hypothetical protein